MITSKGEPIFAHLNMHGFRWKFMAPSSSRTRNLVMKIAERSGLKILPNPNTTRRAKRERPITHEWIDPWTLLLPGQSRWAPQVSRASAGWPGAGKTKGLRGLSLSLHISAMINCISSTFFSWENLKKNIRNHSQIVGNHGQRPEITAECGRTLVSSPKVNIVTPPLIGRGHTQNDPWGLLSQWCGILFDLKCWNGNILKAWSLTVLYFFQWYPMNRFHASQSQWMLNTKSTKRRKHVSRHHISGLVQDCSISSALALDILQSCTKPSISGNHYYQQQQTVRRCCDLNLLISLMYVTGLICLHHWHWGKLAVIYMQGSRGPRA